MTAFLCLEDVSFCWPEGRPVLREVSLDIFRSDTLALMGANGSGKTTLGKLLLGLICPTRGRVLLAGRPLQEFSLAQRASRVGYVFQNPEKQFFAATVAEDIGFALRYRGLPPDEVAARVADMLALFELEHCAGAFPFNLSQGEKQRLALAGVMAMEPEFVILDEPFTGLDRVRRDKLATVLTRLAARGVGYLLISHDPALGQELCSRILTLRGGRLHEK